MENKRPKNFPSILFEDNWLLVIDKPAGLIVQKSHTHNEQTLEAMLPEAEELERKGIVHRLDRDTSGVMVIAKTVDAQTSLQRQFAERQTHKEYVALVWDEVLDEHAIIDAPIMRHPSLGYKYVVAEGGRESKTEFWREAVYEISGQKLSLLRIKLHTGRTHQARVHLFALGHPLVGDKVYGRRKDKTGIRHFLHALRLTFKHPGTNEAVDFEAPLAADLQQFLETLTLVEDEG